MSHLGGWAEQDPHTYLPDIWGYLSLKYSISSVLDVGCGTGHSLKWFRDYRKARVLGIEGDPKAIEHSVIPTDRLRQHDYTQGPLEPKSEYDLGLSLEFVEHVEEQYVPNFMITFTKCRYVLISHAIPGQGGYHHVNCQKKEYWLNQFKKYKFKELAKESNLFSQTNTLLKSPWCRGNLIFFKNENL